MSSHHREQAGEPPILRTATQAKQGRSTGLVYVLGASLALAVAALLIVWLVVR